MAKPTTQPNSEAKPPITTTAREAVVGHVEKVVQAHATTPALEHAWQAVQEGARVVLERVLAHAQQAVQVVVQVVVAVVKVHVEVCVVAQNEIIEHTNHSRM